MTGPGSAAWRLDLGARPGGDGATRFRVWAPRAREVAVILPESGSRAHPLVAEGDGYFAGTVPGVGPGDRYLYRLDGGEERPDPASRHQPDGVHAPSAVVDPDRFPWRDGEWSGLPLEEYVIYELHVGTFTQEGTFAAAIDRLPYLLELGVTAVELMPVAQFPGERNWGYDGVYPFAPQESYGGPDGLKLLVDACHRAGLAVILDVVYNHLGPEGNYLGRFGPYFTDRYRTPWGDAVNFDGPQSDPVRHYFVANALYWITEYHVDALRLDAVHGIFDFGARHILAELAAAVHREGKRLGRKVAVIAESDLNDARLIAPPELGGYGLDAQWNDDFHHALRTLLTGEQTGYYADFGTFPHLIKAFREGFVYSGEYSRYRRRSHGNSSANRSPRQLVVFAQNHDQVGNRMRGERLGADVTNEQLKLAAGAVLLSPYLPLIFMGEEYGEPAPFPYFVSHGDPELIEAVRRGRREEFTSFAWQGEVPDPQAEETFRSARIDPELRRDGEHGRIFALYRELIRLRREFPPLARLDRGGVEVSCRDREKLLAVRRTAGGEEVVCLFNFGGERREWPLPAGTWRDLISSAAPRFGGEGEEGPPGTVPPFGFVVYRKE